MRYARVGCVGDHVAGAAVGSPPHGGGGQCGSALRPIVVGCGVRRAFETIFVVGAAAVGQGADRCRLLDRSPTSGAVSTEVLTAVDFWTGVLFWTEVRLANWRGRVPSGAGSGREGAVWCHISCDLYESRAGRVAISMGASFSTS